MKYELIFAAVALALLLGVVALFAWRLLMGRTDQRREWARVEENVEALRTEYARILEQRSAGRLSESDFKEREEELVLRVIDETAGEAPEHDRSAKNLPMLTAVALALFIPATTVGAYLYFGDFSSLDEKAVAQVEAARAQAESERNMAETVSKLEASVKKNRDNLEAWEILGEHYNSTGNLSEAQIAYENVVRLDPKNANAYAELADLLIANSEGDLSPKVEEYALAALALDPYHQKALMIAGAVEFNHGRYADAAIYFARLRSQVPEGNEIHATLSEQIEMALRMGGLKEIPKDPVPPKPADAMGGMGMMMQKLGVGAAPGADPEADGMGLMGGALPKP